MMTHNTRDPAFHKEIDKADARAGDYVWFYADRGGFRHGIVQGLSGTKYLMIKAEGRLKAEKVPRTRVDNVYRDIFVEKEKIC